MQKLIGKKQLEEILGGLVIKPPGKPTLVSLSDKRQAMNVSDAKMNSMKLWRIKIMANVNRTKVITRKNTRLSYYHGWKPVSINGGAEKYSVYVLILKNDTEAIKVINAAVDAAIEEESPSSEARSLTRFLDC